MEIVYYLGWFLMGFTVGRILMPYSARVFKVSKIIVAAIVCVVIATVVCSIGLFFGATVMNYLGNNGPIRFVVIAVGIWVGNNLAEKSF